MGLPASSEVRGGVLILDTRKMQPRSLTGKGYSRKKLDLTGRRFGKLTVVGPAENIGDKTAWICRCDCGQEKVVKTVRLQGGRAVDCGCSGGKGNGPLHLTYIDGTCVEMLQAKTVRRNNTSGATGVEWVTSKERWRATICFKGRRRYLGTYQKFEDAVKARKRAEEELYEPFLREFDSTALQLAETTDLDPSARFEEKEIQE